MGDVFVEGGKKRKGKEKEKGKGKKGKKEKKRKERERGRERGREKEGEKEIDVFFLSSLVFRRLELIRPRSKVCIFNEGCAPRGRDSSYFGLFLSFGLLFWVDLGPSCAMFMAWDRFVAGIKGCFQDKYGLKHCVYRELPKCLYTL